MKTTTTSKRAEAKATGPAPISRRLAWLTEAEWEARAAAGQARAEAAAAVADPLFGLAGRHSEALARLVEANAADRAWQEFVAFWDGGCELDGVPTTLEKIEAALAWADEQVTDAARNTLPNSTSGAHNLMRAHETHARLNVFTLNFRSVRSVLTHARRFLRDGSCYDDLAAAEVTAIHQEQDRYRDG
jgi:predicted alpha/beta-fold hydrolase